MLDEKLIITLQKVGQQIENANCLDSYAINVLAKDIPEYMDYLEGGEEDFLDSEEIYESATWLNENNEVVLTLKDGSKWKYIRSSYRCIMHSFTDYSNSIDVSVFQCLDKENLFKCSDCGHFLQSYNGKIDMSFQDEELLFPRDWNDIGIEAWCKKREIKQKEYEAKQEERRVGREKDYYNLNGGDCWNCIHMKHSECEYGNDYDYEEECEKCEDWEER